MELSAAHSLSARREIIESRKLLRVQPDHNQRLGLNANDGRGRKIPGRLQKRSLQLRLISRTQRLRKALQ
jgi:hypothetical protein